MRVLESEAIALRSKDDVVTARQRVREWATRLGYTLVDQTRLVTATSELARNAVDHGHGGTMTVEHVTDGESEGLRLTFEDHGPGIPEVDRALQDGYSTAGGLGLGLGGARRLSHTFEIESRPGEGTRVVIVRWR